MTACSQTGRPDDGGDHPVGGGMKSFRINRVVFAVGALIIGVVLLVWPSISLQIIAKCLGIVLAGGGIAAAFFYFKDHENTMKSVLLLMAVVMLICGIVIFLYPENLINLIPTIIGIMVIFSGLINLGETFILSKQKYSRWWISLIVAVLTIAAGVFIVVKASSMAALITRIAGGTLLFVGISDLWVTFRLYTSEKNKDAATTVDGKAEEVKTEPVPAPDAPEEKKPEPASAASEEKKPEPAPAVPEEKQPEPASEAPKAEESAEEPAEEAAEEAVFKAELVFDEEPADSAADNVPASSDDVPEYMKQEEQDQEYHAPEFAEPEKPQDEGEKA